MSSKLHAPALTPFQLNRVHLAERIGAASAVRLVVLRAPAGFGKTTAMLQHAARLRQRGSATAWLNLDASDNDLGRFLPHLVAAVECVTSALPADTSSGGVLDLIGRIAASSTSFTLFLDDFEAIQNPTVLDLIRQVVERMPPGWQIVIGSRAVPGLGLGRLRALGHVLEIGLDQLRFSPEEAGDFLRERRGLSLSGDIVTRLHGATEGWATALWLASLALEDHAHPEDFLRAFSGSHAPIAEFLAEDVLWRQPESMRDFLMRTSVLRQISAPLCDAMLGRDDSAEVLAQLHRANLFLISVDQKGQWFRYHSLFADFLQAQLAQREPDAADAADELHRRAAQWFEANARPVPAIEHALHMRGQANAARLLDLHAQALLQAGRFRLLARWLDKLPSEWIDVYPMLGAVHAWSLAFTHRYQESLALLHRLEARVQQSSNESSNAADDGLRAHVLAMRPLLLSLMDRGDAIALAIHNHPLVDPSHHLPYSLLTNTLAGIYAALGRFDEARALLDRARRSHHKIGSTFNMVYAECVEGSISMRQGRLQDAIARFRVAMNHMTLEASGRADGHPTAAVSLAEALYEAGQLDQAERILTVYLPITRELGPIDLQIRGHITLARLAWQRGESERAFGVLGELEFLGHQDDMPRFLYFAELERSRLALLRGDAIGAAAYLRRAEDPGLWPAVQPLAAPAHDIETAAMAHLRLKLRGGDAGEALAELPTAVEQARSEQCHRLALHLMLLWAEALQRTGKAEEARARMAHALAQAAPEGIVQPFADEGPIVAALALACCRANAPRDGAPSATGGSFLERLEQACATVADTGHRNEAAALEPSGGALTEALTHREVHVLNLLAQGKSNAGIAAGLFLSESTIRTHMRNISAKLGASNRTEVVVLARRRGLIA